MVYRIMPDETNFYLKYPTTISEEKKFSFQLSDTPARINSLGFFSKAGAAFSNPDCFEFVDPPWDKSNWPNQYNPVNGGFNELFEFKVRINITRILDLYPNPNITNWVEIRVNHYQPTIDGNTGEVLGWSATPSWTQAFAYVKFVYDWAQDANCIKIDSNGNPRLFSDAIIGGDQSLRPQTEKFTIQNYGTVQYTLQNIFSNPPFIIIRSPSFPFTISPRRGNTTEVEVAFEPTNMGVYTNYKLILDPIPDMGEKEIICSGIARNANICLDYDQKELDFGIVTNQLPPSKCLKIINCSEGAIKITNITLMQDPLGPAFEQIYYIPPPQSPLGVIPYNSSMNIFIRFRPKAIGKYGENDRSKIIIEVRLSDLENIQLIDNTVKLKGICRGPLLSITLEPNVISAQQGDTIKFKGTIESVSWFYLPVMVQYGIDQPRRRPIINNLTRIFNPPYPKTFTHSQKIPKNIPETYLGREYRLRAFALAIGSKETACDLISIRLLR